MERAGNFSWARREFYRQFASPILGAAILGIAVSFATPARSANETQTPTKRRTPIAKSNADSEDALAKAADLVKESSYYETSGDQENRVRCLHAAIATVTDFSNARWLLGQLKVDGAWSTAEEVIQKAAADGRLADYERRRAQAADNEVGSIQLGQWCAERRLDGQARAHFMRALEFNPENLVARAALGYKKYQGRWLTQADVEQQTVARARRMQALNAWLPEIVRLRNALASDSPSLREAAVQRFREIDDVTVIPALEQAFSVRNIDLVIALIDKLSQWSDDEATAAIARQAIFSPFQPVRQLAATKLNERPTETYVPQMLAAMKSPIAVFRSAHMNGMRPETRDVLVQEDQAGTNTLIRDTGWYVGSSFSHVSDGLVVGLGGSGGPLNPRKAGPALANSSVARDMREERAAIASSNLQTSMLNARIVDCLRVAAGQLELTDPEQWWNWWDETTEMGYDGAKPSRVTHVAREVSIDSDPYNPNADTYVVTASPWHEPVFRLSCFTSGTKVWTIDGDRPIQSIRIGDLVLSQDVDAGEAAFKPVIRTTVRPPVQILKLETSGETLRCTGGHLFWVAGQGWTKARNLRSGQILHCANGTVQVSLVTEEQQPEQTYNLIVADFNTYFVGPEKILSHDVTERKPTRSILPGLARE